MAEAPRRKKLEKTVDDSMTIQTSQKFYCCRCGTSYSRKKGYFPVRIRAGMKTAEERMKKLQKLIEYGKNYTEYKPIHDELKKLKNGWTL